MLLSALSVVLALIQVHATAGDDGNSSLPANPGPQLARPKIVGGLPAEDGQFPWQVALARYAVPFCGGSVLTRTFVLTAGHCLEGQSPEKMLLEFGAASFRKCNVTRRAVELIVHDGFLLSKQAILNDIGLVRFTSALPEWTATVAPIRLPRRAQATLTLDREKAVVSGWGLTSGANSDVQEVLRHAAMPVIPLVTCAATIGRIYHVRVDRSHICTDTSRGQSAFQGDSGGPLVWQDSDRVLRLVGIVSFGSPNAQIGVPNVFTRVTHFLDWIEKHSDVAVEP